MNANENDPVKTAKPLAAELIWEVEGIAAEIGLPVRVAYNLLRTRALPGQKLAANGARPGRRCASPSGTSSSRPRNDNPRAVSGGGSIFGRLAGT